MVQPIGLFTGNFTASEGELNQLVNQCNAILGLTNSKGAGTVTALTVATANGFAGSSSGGATPALTLTTSVSGLAKGNGTTLSAATAGTDYSAGTSGLATGILKSTTSTGALTIAIAADFPTLNQNTSGNAATATGFAGAKTFTLSGYIETPSDKTYHISPKVPFGAMITETSTICDSGTATATFSISGTPLGGTANAVSNTINTQAQASANVITSGGYLDIAISANSSCSGLAWEITYTRVL